MFNDLPVWAYVAVTLALTHVTIVSVTVFLHRHQAHRALDLHPVVSHFFRFWLWLTTGMSTKGWVATHRKHHAMVETEADPHSPQVQGIGKVFWQGAELYRESARDAEILENYGHGTPDDWLERNVYAARRNIGIYVMLALDLCLFGVIGLTIWAVQMLWIPLFAAGVINGIGHWWGYRNFEPPDASTNIIPFGLFIGGEELHNNHHAFAGSARFATRWYELDIGWGYIRLLQALGLAKVRALAPPPLRLEREPAGQPGSPAQVIAGNRLHLMSYYARSVIGRVYREEKARANITYRRLLRRSRGLLIRHDKLLDSRARRRLETVLSQSHALNVVYDYSVRLQKLWRERTAGNNERLVHALQEWCQQAEQSGIQALEEFARSLRAHTMPAA